MAGRLHDLGKYSSEFQDYLQTAGAAGGDDGHGAEVRERRRVDHSSAGAQYCVERFLILGHLLAYGIAGHHAGLLDGRAEGACLEKRLRKTLPRLPSAALVDGGAPPALCAVLQHAFKRRVDCPSDAAFSISFFVRMVFSCLVDADFLDTERFMAPERARERTDWPPDVLSQLDGSLSRFLARVEATVPDTEVNRCRREVREACLRAASHPPGLFSLTVPTGGGKTLASLAFGLRHALQHSLRRVVVVIPFTSIIEQTAAVFREVFQELRAAGIPDPVLEHHSALDFGEETAASRLACENWDAPVVVTTTVQLYESLLAHRTSRCRKLHRLARSVVILDEAQAIGVGQLDPCLSVLRELVLHYGTSVVLCTATQPAVRRRPEFSIGLEGIREIISEPEALYARLRRVRVDDVGVLPDEELVAQLHAEPRVLCIVSTRRHARTLFGLLGEEEGHFHLSAAMCAAHRRKTLSAIRRQLDRGAMCRVVSTQVIEAGVDIDFPCVFRSLAGVDSVAQAAGRCNRHGSLSGGGRLVLFEPDASYRSSLRFLRAAADATRQVLDREEDLLSLSAVDRYFRLYYWHHKGRWDAAGVRQAFRLSANEESLPFHFDFAKVGSTFRLIDEAGRPVLVPWGEEGRRRVEELRGTPAHVPPRISLLRRLQGYVVQAPKRAWEAGVDQGSLELVQGRYAVLQCPELHYHASWGLDLGAATRTNIYLEI